VTSPRPTGHWSPVTPFAGSEQLRQNPHRPYKRTVPRRIVLDTDIGSDVDDALCLALALASPEVELVAVTHVSGDTRLRARISRRLLDLAGRADVPVYAGRRTPLDGGERFVWFGTEGKGILDDRAATPLPDEDAVEALCRLFRADDDLELVAVGPLTNVAAALAADPSLARRIRQLTVMGGYIRGATYGGAEFPAGIDYNLCADPEASRRVLLAGIPTRLVPIDVTLQVWLESRDARALAASASALHRALAGALRHWTPIITTFLAGSGARALDTIAFLHDPLALACAHDESFCTFEDLPIEPRIADGVFRTVERDADGAGIPRLRCATAVDAARFVAHWRHRLGLPA
jgi:purine nucleosidase